MSVLLDTPLVVDEAAARRDLRAQIARLERSGASSSARGERGPALLSLGELEAVRDALAASSVRFGSPDDPKASLDARIRLERMLADPAAHRRDSVALAEMGLPGCGSYRVKPRLGLVGMLAGWWRVVLSSGCP